MKNDDIETAKDCPFCKITEDRSDSVVVFEDDDILAIMDKYPATPGHMLVLPKKHIETIYEMPAGLGAHIMSTAVLMAKMIKEKLAPDGLNLIQSSERAAGQTIPHFHLHIVPRYNHDKVRLRFGHEHIPAAINELERIASLLKSSIKGTWI
jgi:histidine triad (HIT) family protein